jgi:hypothetical protein
MTDRRRGQPIVIGDFEIEPIERVVVRAERVGTAIIGLAHKEPVAVIVRSPEGTWRIALDDVDCPDPPESHGSPHDERPLE